MSVSHLQNLSYLERQFSQPFMNALKTVFFFALFGFICHYCFSLSAHGFDKICGFQVVALMSIAWKKGHSGTTIRKSFGRTMCIKYVSCVPVTWSGWVVGLRSYDFSKCRLNLTCFLKLPDFTINKSRVVFPDKLSSRFQFRLLNLKPAEFDAPFCGLVR